MSPKTYTITVDESQLGHIRTAMDMYVTSDLDLIVGITEEQKEEAVELNDLLKGDLSTEYINGLCY